MPQEATQGETRNSPTVTAAPSLFTPLSALEVLAAPRIHPTALGKAGAEPTVKLGHLRQVVGGDVGPNVKVYGVE